ncbi:MAG: mechanosensitive ion channel family protein [Planctomycetes bacterium]|nr:mechanosensitive ion channel family protein [Planctomycetota bacterium]
MRHIYLIVLCVLCGAASAAAQTSDAGAEAGRVPLIGASQDAGIARSLVATWVAETSDADLRLILRADGQFVFGSIHGTYRVTGGRLILVTARGEAAYEFDLGQGQLTLRGGDLRRETKFDRRTGWADYLVSLIEMSPATLRHKLARVAVVLGVLVAARLLIYLLQGLSYVLIYTDWGPMGLIWKTNKARVRTLHALALNALKYFIYFSALGFFLSELGVNYATYLASLSVVGLAIGFGSQGLVQDMVTGFFVIFEAQFDVGDMVEFSGQTGVVTELGLRMTKLRNYAGQVVMIPNRNIGVVGKYRLESQLALVDVAISGPEADAAATQLLTVLGREINRQFPGVLLEDPTVEEPLALATGERFVRLRMLFWPGQDWVVNQQLVPRLREAFKRGNLEIPADRVVVSYHLREELASFDWRDQLRKRLTWGRQPTAKNGPVIPDGAGDGVRTSDRGDKDRHDKT